MTPLHRLQLGATVLAILITIGVVGYMLAGYSLIDAIYMVVITVSTVGYEEVHDVRSPWLKLFTIVFIVLGMTAAFYTMGGLIQMWAEGEIERAIGARRRTRGIEQLNRHVIVCGYGRMGQILAEELHRQGRPLVVIDRDPERAKEAEAEGFLSVTGDATEEETLQAAGIARARTLATVLPDDASNVFITLTGRDLKRELKIIARGEFPSTQKKLFQAGANHVVLPAATGAMQMANMITRPSAVELMEQVAGRGRLDMQIADVDVRIDEVFVPADSVLVGKSLLESDIRKKVGLIVVGVKHASGQMIFNPDVDLVFDAGDVVIVMGHGDDVRRFEKEYKLRRESDPENMPSESNPNES